MKDVLLGKVGVRDESLIIMEHEQAHIHNGDAFSARVYNAALGASAALYIEIIVPATKKDIHLKEVGLYTTGSIATFTMLEAPAITDGTTPVPVLNRNRCCGRDSILTLFSDPSGISGGVVMDEYALGSGGNVSGGGDRYGLLGWMLKPETKYLLRLVNDAVGAETLYLRTFWHE